MAKKDDRIPVHVLPSADGQFYVRIDGANGEAVYRSTDGYTERNDARESFEWLVDKLAAGDFRVIVSDASAPPSQIAPDEQEQIDRSAAAALERTGEPENPPPGKPGPAKGAKAAAKKSAAKKT